MRRPIVLAAPALAAALVFAPTLRAGFVWDDAEIFEIWLPSVGGLGELLFPSPESRRYFRRHHAPVVAASFWLDREATNRLVGPAPEPLDPVRATVSHAENVLLHAVASSLVAALALVLLPQGRARLLGAGLAGVLFAVHPIHVESVAMITGRTDVLATIFGLGSVLAWVAWRRRGRPGTLVGLAGSTLLALLSKEVAYVLPGLLIVVDRIRSSGVQRVWPAVAACSAAFATAFLLRSHGEGGAVSVAFGVSAADLPGTLARAVSFYLARALVPWPSSPYVAELPGAATLAAGGGLAVAGIVGIAWARPPLRRLLAGCAAWFVIAIAPALYVAVAPDISVTLVAERYLYLPSVAIALAAGAIFASVWQGRPAGGAARHVAVVLTAAALLACTLATILRSRIWHDDVHLWSAVTEGSAAARRATPWFNLGAAQLRAGHPEAAAAAFARAAAGEGAGDYVAGVPVKARAHYWLARLSLDEAERAREPEEILSRTAVARRELRSSQAAGVERLLLEANVFLDEARAHSGSAPQQSRDLLQQARLALEEARRLDPGRPEVRSTLDRVEQAWRALPPG